MMAYVSTPILVTQIEDMHGNIVATFAPKMTEVLTADAAHKMLYMLQNVVNGGTGGTPTLLLRPADASGR